MHYYELPKKTNLIANWEIIVLYFQVKNSQWTTVDSQLDYKIESEWSRASDKSQMD